MVLLRQNDTGERVVELQQLLNLAINANLSLTGIYGPLTRAAVLNFQRTNNLVADGIVGPITWAALNKRTVEVAPERNFYIIAGHDLVRDPGAVNHALNLTEAREAVSLRDSITQKLQPLGATVINDNDSWNLAKTINKIISKVKPNDILIDIHFNAATPAARGVEAFVSDPCTQTENEIAHQLCAITNDVLGIPIRQNWTPSLLPGVKYETATRHKRLGILRPNCQNILWEVCFISNDIEIKNYLNLRDVLATKVANYLNSIKNK